MLNFLVALGGLPQKVCFCGVCFCGSSASVDISSPKKKRLAEEERLRRPIMEEKPKILHTHMNTHTHTHARVCARAHTHT